MKIKRTKAIIAAFAVFASLAAAVPMNSGAAYTSVLGLPSTTIDKYLIMDINANTPNASFTFDIAPFDSTKEAGAKLKDSAAAGSPVVYNGIVGTGANAVVAKVGSTATNVMTFTPDDPTILEGSTDASENVNWVDTDDDKIGNEKYATKSIAFDFGAVPFTAPGVYRYLIKETPADTNMAITNDVAFPEDGNNRYRTLDVTVVDYAAFYDALTETTGYTAPSGNDDELYIAYYTLYAGVYNDVPKTGTDALAITKSESFTNKYTTYELTIGKNVAGNQASKNKYFKFTVNISGALAGTKYDISYVDDTNAFTADGNADKNIAANPNSTTTCITTAVEQPDSIFVGDDGTVQQDFYLHHGQTIVIKGLAKETKYTVSEDKETYDSSPKIVSSGNTITDTTTGSIVCTGITGDNTASFTNTLAGFLPTGILVSVAGPAVVGIIALLGIAVLIFRGRRREREDS